MDTAQKLNGGCDTRRDLNFLPPNTWCYKGERMKNLPYDNRKSLSTRAYLLGRKASISTQILQRAPVTL